MDEEEKVVDFHEALDYRHMIAGDIAIDWVDRHREEGKIF